MNYLNNKNITFISLLGFLPAIAFAGQDSGLAVKVSGSVDTQYGIVKQEDNFKKDLKSDKEYNQQGLAGSGSLKFNIEKKNENDLKYGAFVKLDADIEGDKELKGIAKELKIYLEGNFGKVELGSTDPVGCSMEVNSYSIARATGGLSGDWKSWLKNGYVIKQVNGSKKVVDNGFLTAPRLPIGFDESNKANKINYFSPNINGITFGISYTPDSNAKGTAEQVKETLKDVSGRYKNIWQPTLRYEKESDNGVKFTTAILGQFGNAKDHSYWTKKDDIDKEKPNGYKEREDLRAWQVGGSIEYNGFAFAGSYGDFGKSGIPKDVDENNKKGADYWSLGSAYSGDKYGISINYMQSKRAGYIYSKVESEANEQKDAKGFNKFEAISVGADYEVMPGFMPYVELTGFKFKENENFGKDAKFNKGMVFLAGTKIKF